ncbi:hypothetical protein TRVL_09635 [Trypanosoma vivax]|nr:hypothetical protein TRVL_09635 [Trypanosoma vivax]
MRLRSAGRDNEYNFPLFLWKCDSVVQWEIRAPYVGRGRCRQCGGKIVAGVFRGHKNAPLELKAAISHCYGRPEDAETILAPRQKNAPRTQARGKAKYGATTPFPS